MPERELITNQFDGFNTVKAQNLRPVYNLNFIRFIGDLLHLSSFLLLFYKIHRSKSVAGISLKTQILYAIVFTCRYLDLFWNWISAYLIIMKLVFLAATYGTIYMITNKYKKSYNRENDKMPLYYLIVPCLVLALIFNKKFTLWEIMWAFSIYLEAVAIFPQLVMLQATGDVDTITYDYMFTLGGYRAFYLINWIYRLATEPEYSEWIVWIAGLVQTGLYCDFFYYYLKSKWYGTKMRLPQ